MLKDIGDILRERKCYENKVQEPHFTLAELQEVNLADLYVTVNDFTLYVAKDEKIAFRITNPTIIAATLTETQLSAMQRLLREKNQSYNVGYKSPYYYKKQGNKWLAVISLNIGHMPYSSVQLVDFGYTFGTIKVNGIAVAISHGGGTHNGKFIDDTSGFHLVGASKIKAFASLIK